jgi:hypothetical protein
VGDEQELEVFSMASTHTESMKVSATPSPCQTLRCVLTHNTTPYAAGTHVSVVPGLVGIWLMASFWRTQLDLSVVAFGQATSLSAIESARFWQQNTTWLSYPCVLKLFKGHSDVSGPAAALFDVGFQDIPTVTVATGNFSVTAPSQKSSLSSRRHKS